MSLTGFLSTDDVEAPGNYALLDQSLAVRYKFSFSEVINY